MRSTTTILLALIASHLLTAVHLSPPSGPGTPSPISMKAVPRVISRPPGGRSSREPADDSPARRRKSEKRLRADSPNPASHPRGRASAETDGENDSGSDNSKIVISNLVKEFDRVFYLPGATKVEVRFIGAFFTAQKSRDRIAYAIGRIRLLAEHSISVLLEGGSKQENFQRYFGKHDLELYNYQTVVLRLLEVLRMHSFVFVPYSHDNPSLADEENQIMMTGGSMPCTDTKSIVLFLDSEYLNDISEESLDAYLSYVIFHGTGNQPSANIVYSPADVNECLLLKDEDYLTEADEDPRWLTKTSRNPANYIHLMIELSQIKSHTRPIGMFVEFFHSDLSTVKVNECQRLSIDPSEITMDNMFWEYNNFIITFGIDDARHYLPRLNPAELHFLEGIRSQLEQIPDAIMTDDNLDVVAQFGMQMIPSQLQHDLDKFGIKKTIFDYSITGYDADLKQIFASDGESFSFPMYAYLTSPVRVRLDVENGKEKFALLRSIKYRPILQSLLVLPTDKVKWIVKSLQKNFETAILKDYRLVICTGYIRRTCKRINHAVKEVDETMFMALATLSKSDGLYTANFHPSEYERVQQYLLVATELERVLIVAHDRKLLHLRKPGPFIDWRSRLIMLARSKRWIFRRKKRFFEIMLNQVVALAADKPALKYETNRRLGVVEEDRAANETFIKCLTNFLKGKYVQLLRERQAAAKQAKKDRKSRK